MKYKLFIFLMIGMMTIVGAVCDETNDFIIGEEINICTGGCFYQNGSECGEEVSCRQSVAYPNGTLIEINGLMERDGNIFNRTIGNSSTDLNSVTGNYFVSIDCISSDGWEDPINFKITISEITNETQSGNSLYTSQIIDINEKIDKLEKEDTDLEKLVDEKIDSKLGFIKENLWLIIIGLVFVFLILMAIVIDITRRVYRKEYV